MSASVQDRYWRTAAVLQGLSVRVSAPAWTRWFAAVTNTYRLFPEDCREMSQSCESENNTNTERHGATVTPARKHNAPLVSPWHWSSGEIKKSCFFCLCCENVPEKCCLSLSLKQVTVKKKKFRFLKTNSSLSVCHCAVTLFLYLYLLYVYIY